jgi:hypothetical protein
MSKITDCLDAIEARLAAILPDHKIMPDPIDPEQNPETILTKAYGLRSISGINTKKQMSCQMSSKEIFEIILTRKFYGTEQNRAAKESVRNQLLEDGVLIRHDTELATTLNDSENVIKFEWQEHRGVVKLFGGDKPFLMHVLSFELEYFENLT